MRRDNSTTRWCRQQLDKLGLDGESVFHKAKLILQIYRDVVWALSDEIEELEYSAYELGGQSLEAGLCYLADFAPEVDAGEFETRVCELMQSKMLVDIVDRALVKLRDYPGNGVVYFEILSKQYIYKNRYTESELLDELRMERSVFYDRKREAVQLFSVCLFGYTLPELQGEALSA